MLIGETLSCGNVESGRMGLVGLHTAVVAVGSTCAAAGLAT
jgi:hypothetical protein